MTIVDDMLDEDIATLRTALAKAEAERDVWKDRADGRLDRINRLEPVVDAAVKMRRAEDADMLLGGPLPDKEVLANWFAWNDAREAFARALADYLAGEPKEGA